jgi:hypothetical protein
MLAPHEFTLTDRHWPRDAGGERGLPYGSISEELKELSENEAGAVRGGACPPGGCEIPPAPRPLDPPYEQIPYLPYVGLGSTPYVNLGISALLNAPETAGAGGGSGCSSANC